MNSNSNNPVEEPAGPAWHDNDEFWRAFAPSMFDPERWQGTPEEVEQMVALLGIEPGARNRRGTGGGSCQTDATRSCQPIATEFSTMDWILEGILERAGFKIDEVEYVDTLFAKYTCTKRAHGGE